MLKLKLSSMESNSVCMQMLKHRSAWNFGPSILDNYWNNTSFYKMFIHFNSEASLFSLEWFHWIQLWQEILHTLIVMFNWGFYVDIFDCIITLNNQGSKFWVVVHLITWEVWMFDIAVKCMYIVDNIVIGPVKPICWKWLKFRKTLVCFNNCEWDDLFLFKKHVS